MGYQSFKDLRVWKEAKDLAIQIYRITSKGKLIKDYGFRDQLQRSAVSIASNIAEGYERNSDKDFIRFLFIAKGSLSELRTQLDIAQSIGHIDNETFQNIENQCQHIGAMLTKLIKSRRNH